MKTLVIYFHPAFRPGYSALWVGDQIVGAVRCELHSDVDPSDALTNAKPREGEIVLNAVEVTP
jgi:hypothetical protein